MVLVEIVVGRGRISANVVVAGVLDHLVGEHILAGVLVAADARKALFVAIVDDRLRHGQKKSDA